MADFSQYKYQDYQLSDATLYSEFVSYWKNGNYQLALDILTNNSSLATKSFTANALNVISAALTYLQNNYYNNVENVLAADLAAFNLAINNFISKATYISTTQYYVNNFVLYNNLWYMCMADSLGNLPTNTTYWVLIGLQGEQGAAGTGLNLRYTWQSTLQYNQYDVVYYQSVLYVALQANSNQNPSTATTYWQILLSVPTTNITVTSTAPTSPYTGQIWGQIIT
jgi:hypothetical protein